MPRKGIRVRSATGDPNRCDYTDDENDFLRAVEHYKRENRRPHPAWTEVLAVLISRGWRRVAEPGELPRWPPAGAST